MTSVSESIEDGFASNPSMTSAERPVQSGRRSKIRAAELCDGAWSDAANGTTSSAVRSPPSI